MKSTAQLLARIAPPTLALATLAFAAVALAAPPLVSSAPPSASDPGAEPSLPADLRNLSKDQAKALKVPEYIFGKDGRLNPQIKWKPKDRFAKAPPFWQALNAWRRPPKPAP